jgi:hypothetical protein
MQHDAVRDEVDNAGDEGEAAEPDEVSGKCRELLARGGKAEPAQPVEPGTGCVVDR